MNEEDKIKVGDTVAVNFHCSQSTLSHAAEVLHVPSATGESWVFKDQRGAIHYVSEGCTISKHPR